ncbi:DNA glycosylase AlkZ-like family protein [Piscinibacter terrae]|uniref:DNA glycosylase AlkZ-like family protein n=1 Tax=Piscinibacter terrae TaxID=2496871 RepID=UPI0026940A88
MALPPPQLDDLRRHAVARSLFKPTTLHSAIRRLGFIQADPIRAPARAQDLTLRHRVKDYRAGDLERRYPRLQVEEDFFVNYGFLSADLQRLMHPRTPRAAWPAATRKRSQALLDFIRERGEVHPREVDAHFAHGSVENYWGGSSSATTHLLDGMHYRGLIRVARRENGIRIYAAHEHADAPLDAAQRREQLDALVDVIIRKYAPLPAASLSNLVRRLRHGTPQWQADLTAAIQRARQRLSHARIDGVDWFWPADEKPSSSRHALKDEVRLLAPFDPIVWDRRRFELFWGWAYRFEAYTPAAKRKLGYYALPLLWCDQVVGWCNANTDSGRLKASFGYVEGRAPRDRAFRSALADEVDRLKLFLDL